MKYFKNRTKLKKLYEDNQENLISHIALRKKGLNSNEKIDFPKGENFITKLKKDIALSYCLDSYMEKPAFRA